MKVLQIGFHALTRVQLEEVIPSEFYQQSMRVSLQVFQSGFHQSMGVLIEESFLGTHL